MMRWTRPDIYNSVRNCARHMQGLTKDNYQTVLRFMDYVIVRDCTRRMQGTTADNYQAMLRVMDYVIATPERGLFVAPKGEGDGRNGL